MGLAIVGIVFGISTYWIKVGFKYSKANQLVTYVTGLFVALVLVLIPWLFFSESLRDDSTVGITPTGLLTAVVCGVVLMIVPVVYERRIDRKNREE